MNTLQTLVNIALNKPAYRERALYQLRRNADKFHAMEVEAEYEAVDNLYNSTLKRREYYRQMKHSNYLAKLTLCRIYDDKVEAVSRIYDVIYDIHTANKNGALA